MDVYSATAKGSTLHHTHYRRALPVSMKDAMARNLDEQTVAGFGAEWSRFDQSAVTDAEALAGFQAYFDVFPWSELPEAPVGFDLGCGSGRWARLVAPRVGVLHCIDASPEALAVAQKNCEGQQNCVFHAASVDAIPLRDGSMDFGYSLGVLHHVPDTLGGIRSCVAKLKPGAPFLLYLYYALENRPSWHRAMWQVSNAARRVICRLPFPARYGVSQLAAFGVYYPLARGAALFESLGADVHNWPLAAYRRYSVYTMRTDALDRFGTRVEQRFTRSQIKTMMESAGLERIRFRDGVPYWCAVGYRAAAS